MSINISDGAVEAALEALDANVYIDSGAKVRAILNAAAPHMMYQAWGEGERTGRGRAMRMMSDEPNLSLVAPNPYATKEPAP